jgi:membrane protein
MTTFSEQFREVIHLGGLSVIELQKRVWREIQKDNVLGYAAQLAYYFLFSLFPFFLFLAALIGYIPIPNLLERIMELLGKVMPQEALHLVQDNVRDIVTQQRGGLLSLGIVVALWSASAAMSAIMDALNRAYGVEEGRPYWKAKGTAVLLTIGFIGFTVISIILLMFGPQIGGWIATKLGLSAIFHMALNILRWPVILFLITLAMAVLYYFAPDVEQEWKWITPGSIFAVVGWTLASLAFSYYVNNFGSYNETYGSIGAIIVLLTWMYLTGLFILIGGEINSEIEHAAVSGKAPGEKEIRRTSPARV